jgi:hypothetical protein
VYIDIGGKGGQTMPRMMNKHGELKTISFKPAHIALLLYMGREVYPDEGITMEQFQDENSQVQQALEKLLRNHPATRFAAVGEKGKEYVDASTGEVIAHDDPRRKRLDEIDRKKPGSIRHFAGGGFLTDSDGAIRFDDKTDMGKANVSSVLGSSDMSTPSTVSATSPMTPATQPSATPAMMQPSGLSAGDVAVKSIPGRRHRRNIFFRQLGAWSGQRSGCQYWSNRTISFTSEQGYKHSVTASHTRFTIYKQPYHSNTCASSIEYGAFILHGVNPFNRWWFADG